MAAKKLKEKKVAIRLEKVSVMQHGHEVCAKCEEIAGDRAVQAFFKGLLVAIAVVFLVHIVCVAVEA